MMAIHNFKIKPARFRPSARLFLAALAALPALAPAAAPAVDLDNNFQITSLDLPVINVSLSLDGVAPLVSPDGVDPNDPFHAVNTINFQAFYDTGTSGIVLSNEVASSFGLQKLQASGNNIVYSDIAIGGAFETNVSQSLYVRLARNNPTVNGEDTSVYNQQFGSFNVEVAKTDAPLGEDPQNIVGTPAMAGKVVVFDSIAINRTLNQIITNDPNTNLDDLGLRTYVYNPGTAFVGGDSNPGIPPVNFRVKLSNVDLSRLTFVTPSGSQFPKLAGNPFIGPNPLLQLQANPPADPTPKVKITYNGASAEGSFLLDSGAQFSMISNAMAQQLHITHQDPNNPSSPLEYIDPSDPGNPQLIPDQFSSTVGGAGSGTLTAPGFYLDSLLARTLENTSGLDSDPNNLVFLHVPVLVADITGHDPDTDKDLTLDGVFGMNLLTAGGDPVSLALYIFGAIDLEDLQASTGAFDYVTYDQTNGILGLTLSGSAVPEPSTAVLAAFGVIAAGIVAARRKRATPLV